VSGGRWGVRWYEGGRRCFKSGFSSKGQARDHFDNVVKPRLLGQPEKAPELTFDELCDKYLSAHAAAVSPSTIATLEARLVRPRKEFGDVLVRDLERRVVEIAGWRAKLPGRFRYAVMSAFRQVCAAGVRWGAMSSNPAVAVGSNPQPAVVERDVLEPREVDALADEMNSPYGAAVVVAAWCYLRPSELLALQRRDVGDGVLNVRGTKTARSVRTVPLPRKASEALKALPARIDTRLLFAGPSGMLYDGHNWRKREFEWARDAAGLAKTVTPYTLRHSGISWALAAGVPASDVARFGGTSLEMLQRTYAHLLEGSADAARARLDLFSVASEKEAAEEPAEGV
jgi:integrase